MPRPGSLPPGDLYINGLFGAVSDNPDRDLVAGLVIGQGFPEVSPVRNLLPVSRDDDVPGAEPGLRGRRPVLHLADEQSPSAGRLEIGTQIFGHRLDLDADVVARIVHPEGPRLEITVRHQLVVLAQGIEVVWPLFQRGAQCFLFAFTLNPDLHGVTRLEVADGPADVAGRCHLSALHLEDAIPLLQSGFLGGAPLLDTLQPDAVLALRKSDAEPAVMIPRPG